MKINIKAKDLADLVALQKVLDNKLKKPVNALLSGVALPFCYEVALFPDGGGFLCIGETKEIQNIWKKQRSKGQYKKPDGTIEKVDKKKVAYGTVQLNADGVFEFVVEGGTMKRAQAKIVIKSITILKKNIGDNFVILNQAPELVEEDLATQDEAPVTDDSDPTEATESLTEEELKALKKKQVIRQAKRKKVEEGIGKLHEAAGIADAEKIRANITKYKEWLDELVAEAEEDGVVTKKERKEINETKGMIEQLEQILNRLGNRKIKLTPKNRTQINKNVEAIDNKMREMAEQLGIEL